MYMLHRILSWKIGWALALLAFLDVFGVGLGMGVPIFCILLGLPAGWYIARRIMARSYEVKALLGKMLLGTATLGGFTFLLMAVVWGRCLPMLFDPTADLAHFGIPLILYEPKASFIGWLVLMVIISPFLQFLMALLGANLAVLWGAGERYKNPPAGSQPAGGLGP